MYSALISRSLTLALMPRFNSTGRARLPDFGEQVEILHVAGADLEHVGIAIDQLDAARVHHLGDDRHAVLVAGVAEDLQPFLAHVPETHRGWCGA